MTKGFGRRGGLYTLDRARSTRGGFAGEKPISVHGHPEQKTTAGLGTASSSSSRDRMLIGQERVGVSPSDGFPPGPT